MTTIEWTEETWNPTTGCTRISEGCDHCYIERTPPMRMAHRRFDGPQIGATTGVQLHPERLVTPLRWRKPRRIFVNSMSDLFHDDVPHELIAWVFAVMAWSPRHTYQVLTKRPARMRALLSSSRFHSLVDDAWYSPDIAEHAGVQSEAGHPYDRWPLPNVWLGVSVESQKWADIRIPQLIDTPAAVRWISAEPLLGPVDLSAWMPGLCNCAIPLPPTHVIGCRAMTYRALDWVVVGGESGPGSRPMDPAWARDLRDQCTAAAVPFFYKQTGDWMPTGFGFGSFRDPDRLIGAPVDDLGFRQIVRRVGKKQAGRELDGRTWDEYPKRVLTAEARS